jgi:RimJ/RimL family protein N-acetyltransferase
MSYRIGEKEAEIGIKICNSSFQEQGIGTIALRLLIEYLFFEKNVDKIHLDTNLKNTRAQHVYEKLGFCKIKIHMDSWRDQLVILQSFVEYDLQKENYNLQRI